MSDLIGKIAARESMLADRHVDLNKFREYKELRLRTYLEQGISVEDLRTRLAVVEAQLNEKYTHWSVNDSFYLDP